FTKFLTTGAGLAAIAAVAPASAQYGYPAYGAPYGNAYGYNNNMTQFAAQRCSAAVQQRLSTRVGLSGILGAVLGNQSAGGRVLSVTRVEPRNSTIRVRGLANSGNYGQYGYGAYGAVGYAYQPDLSFRCVVDYRGRIRDIDINRR
ncbi:MAG TPA: hypothetical protein VGR05_06635, partial [Sphingomicrobium sp.]|nr:hypothetical protein [Sphingomicrobium sp.]